METMKIRGSLGEDKTGKYRTKCKKSKLTIKMSENTTNYHIINYLPAKIRVYNYMQKEIYIQIFNKLFSCRLMILHPCTKEHLTKH